MMLPSPAVDLALPLAFTSLALVSAVGFALDGWPDAVGLCVGGVVGGLLWAREVLPFALEEEAEREDG